VIDDFDVAVDTIWLDNAIFTVLATGALSSGAFVANASGPVTQADDRITYETDTGYLRYDSDGSGAAAAIHFATLDAGLSLTAADIFVV
jgi:Ca2+-binding RTX toxin-like protein